MTYLSEDPTILAGGLLLLAAAFGVALKATQQGKYLIRALAALGLAAAVVVIEWTWVTDNERIEQVVYDLRQAVLNSDADGILAHLAPDVRFQRGGTTLEPDTTRDLVRTNLSNATFEFVRISNLQTSAGQQSRRGAAEFRVFAKGSLHTSLATMNIGTANSVWSLGFRETNPGVWQVNRITPVQLPNGALTMPSGASGSAIPPVGSNSERTGRPRPLMRGNRRAGNPPQAQGPDRPGPSGND